MPFRKVALIGSLSILSLGGLFFAVDFVDHNETNVHNEATVQQGTSFVINNNNKIENNIVIPQGATKSASSHTVTGTTAVIEASSEECNLERGACCFPYNVEQNRLRRFLLNGRWNEFPETVASLDKLEVVRPFYDKTEKMFTADAVQNCAFNIVRWTGELSVEEAGDYTFLGQTNKGNRYYVPFALSVNGSEYTCFTGKDGQGVMSARLKKGYNTISVVLLNHSGWKPRPATLSLGYRLKSKITDYKPIAPGNLFSKRSP